MDSKDIIITSSVNDKPIKSGKENLLGIDSYAEALSQFIQYSATPMTIGVQGEWGTGKTSLMNLIRENLESDEKSLATAWVNTCLLYTSPSPRDRQKSRMPSSA